jgi:hypothetical protein
MELAALPFGSRGLLKKKNLGCVEMLNKISYDVLGSVYRSSKDG